MSLTESQVQILIEDTLLESLVAVADGDQLCRDIVVTNNSTTTNATTVAATIVVPVGTTVASGTPTQGTYAAGTWNIGTLTPGQSETLTLCLTIDDSCEIPANVTASITFDQCDPDATNNTTTKLYAGLSCCEIAKCASVINPEDHGAVLYVAKTGDNGTAVRGNEEYPYADPWAARTAALDGDLIYIYPGEYTVRDSGGDVNVALVGDATFYKNTAALTYYAEPGVKIDANASIEAPLFYDADGGNSVKFYGYADIRQDGSNNHRMIVAVSDDTVAIIEADKIASYGYWIGNSGSFAELSIKVREGDFTETTRGVLQNGLFDGSGATERAHMHIHIQRAEGLDAYEELYFSGYNVVYEIEELFFNGNIHTVGTSFPGWDVRDMTNTQFIFKFGNVDATRTEGGFSLLHDIYGTFTNSSFTSIVEGSAVLRDYSQDSLIHPAGMTNSTIRIQRGLSKITNSFAGRNDANIVHRPNSGTIDADSLIIIEGTYQNDTNGCIILNHEDATLSTPKGIILESVVLKSSTTESIASRNADTWGANVAPAGDDPIVIIGSAVANVGDQANVGIQGNMLAVAPQL